MKTKAYLLIDYNKTHFDDRWQLFNTVKECLAKAEKLGWPEKDQPKDAIDFAPGFLCSYENDSIELGMICLEYE